MQIISTQLYRALINHTVITTKNYRGPRESITKDNVGESITRNRVCDSMGKLESRLRRKFSGGKYQRQHPGPMDVTGLRSRGGKTHLEAAPPWKLDRMR